MRLLLGTPAPNAILDLRCLGGALRALVRPGLLGQHGDAHRLLDPRPLLELGLGPGVVRAVLRVARPPAAQAARRIEIAGGSGGSTHDFRILFNPGSASMPIVSLAISSTRRSPGRRGRARGARASDEAACRAGRRASARR